MRVVILDEYLSCAHAVILFGIMRRAGLERFSTAGALPSAPSPPPPALAVNGRQAPRAGLPSRGSARPAPPPPFGGKPT